MRYAYPCKLEPDKPAGSFTITFPDIREANTGGSSLGEAMENAQEALEISIMGRLEIGDKIPEPSKLKNGQELVPLTPSAAAKTAMILEMRYQNIQPREIQHRMGITHTEIQDLVDPQKISSLERLTQALQVMGRAVILEDTQETAGNHFRIPAGTQPMGYDEFIRRLRRYCTHRNIPWALLHNETDNSGGVSVGDRTYGLQDVEISTQELASIMAGLRINPEEF